MLLFKYFNPYTDTKEVIKLIRDVSEIPSIIPNYSREIPEASKIRKSMDIMISYRHEFFDGTWFELLQLRDYEGTLDA